jgi:hypothetical protein
MVSLSAIEGLAVEHEVLWRALERAGICLASVESTQSKPPLLVAWSPRESFLIRPEYAWLSVQGGSFLQLPTSSKHFMEFVTAERAPVDPKSDLYSLLTPVGQWRWAVRKLGETISAGKHDEGLLRVKALLDYARDHWPGAFDPALNMILRDLGKAHHPTLLRCLETEVEGIAAAQACVALTRWHFEPNLFSRMTLLQDLLCYFQQGLIDSNSLWKTIEQDTWRNELTRDLDTSLRMLASLQHEVSVSREPLTDSCQRVAQNLRKVESIYTLSAGIAPDDARRALDAIETLVLQLEELAFKAQATVEGIAQACEEVAVGWRAP